MTLIMISLDKKIFQSGSETQQRMIKYGKLADKLFIVVFTGRHYQPTRLADNVWVYPTFSWHRFLCFFDAVKLIGWLIKKEKLEAEKCRVTVQDPFETALAGWLIKKKFKIFLQIQIHTDFLSPFFWRESLLNKIRVIIAKWLVGRADNWRVVSGRIKNSLVSFLKIPAVKIFVIPIYVDGEKIRRDPPRFDLRRQYPDFDFIILNTGRLSREKNLLFFLEIFRELVRFNSKALFLMVGEGAERQKIARQIAGYGLGNNVKIEPWTNDPASYYQGADLFIFCSNYEGYGRTVIEAMAAGLPVVMTDVGCAEEIIKNGANGLVLERDKKVWLENIKRLMKDGEWRRQLSEAARTAVKNLPSEEVLLNMHKQSWNL